MTLIRQLTADLFYDAGRKVGQCARDAGSFVAYYSRQPKYAIPALLIPMMALTSCTAKPETVKPEAQPTKPAAPSELQLSAGGQLVKNGSFDGMDNWQVYGAAINGKPSLTGEVIIREVGQTGYDIDTEVWEVFPFGDYSAPNPPVLRMSSQWNGPSLARTRGVKQAIGQDVSGYKSIVLSAKFKPIHANTPLGGGGGTENLGITVTGKAKGEGWSYTTGVIYLDGKMLVDVNGKTIGSDGSKIVGVADDEAVKAMKSGNFKLVASESRDGQLFHPASKTDPMEVWEANYLNRWGADALKNVNSSIIVPRNQWYALKLDLKSLPNPPDYISEIFIRGTGWSFIGEVDDVSVEAYGEVQKPLSSSSIKIIEDPSKIPRKERLVVSPDRRGYEASYKDASGRYSIVFHHKDGDCVLYVQDLQSPGVSVIQGFEDDTCDGVLERVWVSDFGLNYPARLDLGKYRYPNKESATRAYTSWLQEMGVLEQQKTSLHQQLNPHHYATNGFLKPGYSPRKLVS